MIYVLGKVAIADLPQFVSVFATVGAEARKRHGSRSCELFRIREEANRVVVLFEWESPEAFQAFLEDARVKETMKSSGTMGPPEFTLLDKVATFPS